jgi:Protein of unknown function (DUF3237)
LVIDGVTIPTATLHPMGVMRVKLGELADVGVGPKGNRMIRNVLSIELKSEKLNATLANVGSADWLNVNEDVSANIKDAVTRPLASSPRHQHFKPAAKNING